MAHKKPSPITPPETSSYFIFRSLELRLMIWVTLLMVWIFGLSAMSRFGQGTFSVSDLMLPVIWFGAMILAHGILVLIGSGADESILPIVSFLTSVGMAFQYRLGSISGMKWGDVSVWIYAAVPLIIALTDTTFRNGRLNRLEDLKWIWLLGTILVPLWVMLMGVDYRGARFGPGKTTPTECVKPMFVLLWSACLAGSGIRPAPEKSKKKRGRLNNLGMMVMFWMIPQVIFGKLHDFGMIGATGLLLIVLIAMGTGRLIYLLGGIIGASVLGVVMRTWLPIGIARFEAWLAPFEHPDTTGFQIIQSLFALFNGAFAGRGIGGGFPEKIPMQTSDFVYSALAEEMGLAGSFLVVVCIMELARKGYFYAIEAGMPFESWVAAGCGTVIWIQVLLHVGGVTNVIPMTGVPMPFISLGGSAMISFSIMIGMIMAVSDKD